MAFDKQWEAVFRTTSWGRYPNEDVIRFTEPNFPDKILRKDVRILDLDCGGGATTWYLAREGFDVYGVDGSPSAIRMASSYLSSESLDASLTVGDFVSLAYESEYFDAIYDIGAIQHNKIGDIRKIYKEINRTLKPGGCFFSIAINDETSGKEKADEIEKNTFLHLKSIKQDVLIHLFTKDEIRELTNPFDDVSIESLLRTQGAEKIGHYLISAHKKG